LRTEVLLPEAWPVDIHVVGLIDDVGDCVTLHHTDDLHESELRSITGLDLDVFLSLLTEVDGFEGRHLRRRRNRLVADRAMSVPRKAALRRSGRRGGERDPA
jgi:hypothetical protein